MTDSFIMLRAMKWQFTILVLCVIYQEISGNCDQSVRWLDGFNVNNLYGVWFAVGYAQHTPDVTDRPTRIGCIVLHIDDITEEKHKEWAQWPMRRMNDSHYSGAWLNGQVSQQMRHHQDYWTERKSYANEKVLRLVWIEDDFRTEQHYVYNNEAPALWKYELRREDQWDPEIPEPKKYEVIRVFKATSSLLVINHCMESGDGRVFSLVFQRQPGYMSHWDWIETKKLFHAYDISQVYREISVCSGCRHIPSLLSVVFVVYGTLRLFYYN